MSMASCLDDMMGKSVYLGTTVGILLLVGLSSFRLYFLARPIRRLLFRHSLVRDTIRVQQPTTI